MKKIRCTQINRGHGFSYRSEAGISRLAVGPPFTGSKYWHLTAGLDTPMTHQPLSTKCNNIIENEPFT